MRFHFETVTCVNYNLIFAFFLPFFKLKLKLKISIETGPRTTTFEGSCAEAYVGEQRLVPARSANLEDLAPNANLAGPPYNIIKG